MAVHQRNPHSRSIINRARQCFGSLTDCLSRGVPFTTALGCPVHPPRFESSIINRRPNELLFSP
jgi:hypothetical protein